MPLTPEEQAIQDKIKGLQQEITNATQAGYGAGGQFAGQQIPTSVLNAPTQPNQIGTTFGTQAGTGQGFQFGNALQTAIDRMNAISPMTNYRQLLIKHLYDQPLTPDELKQLPPEYQQMVNTGNKQELEMGVRLLNDQISNRTGTLDQSVNFLTNLYTQSQQNLETQKQQAITSVLNYSKALNQKPSTIMKALYPTLAADLGPQLDTLAAPLLTSTQIPTSLTGSQYDLSTYAPTNPNYTGEIANILSTMGDMTTPQSIQQYISSVAPNSPITGDMILSAATQYGIDPKVLTAILQQESQLGTDGSAGATMNNPGNVGNTDQAMAQGQPVGYPDMQSGVDAVAQWLANNQKQVSPAPPDPNKGNVVDPITNLTPNAIYQDALEYMFTGKMPALGLGSAVQVRNQRQAIINKAGAITTAMGNTLPQLQALYAANKSAATQNVQRLARIESIAQSMTLNFPRLEQLADQVKAAGITLTESDLQATQADIERRFGGTAAAGYIELLQTMRSDYASTQAALAGSRGGQFFSAQASDAIPLGLTSDQYENIKNQILLSSQNAGIAINQEVQSLIGTSGNISGSSVTAPKTQTQTGGTYEDYLKAIGQ